MTSKNKIISADLILENLKIYLLDILWNTDSNEYSNIKFFIPWIQQDAEYSIIKLKLNKKDKEYYLKKIGEIVGEYSEYF